MKRWIGIAMLLIPLCLTAQSFWDGNATVQRGDTGFESGLFAVSNSFPADSRIVVQNLDTGQSTTATVTQRIDGQPDLLLMLSPSAANAIGIPLGAMARVRVTLAPPAPSVPRATQTQEQVASRDPDINPGAAYPQDAQKAAAPGRTAGTQAAAATPLPSEESLPASVAPQPAPSSPTPVSAPEAPQPETAQPQVTTPQVAVATPESSPATAIAEAEAARQKAADAAIIAAAQSRQPQKQLFLPPREDEKFAYHKPAETPVQAATPAAPQITAVIGEPGASPPPGPQPDLALADAVAPQIAQPQEIVGAETVSPGPGPAAQTALAEPEPIGEPQKPVQTEVTGPVAVPAPQAPAPQVALAAPQPPAERAAAATPTAPTTAPTTPRQVPAVTPPKQRGTPWYLQLAAYETEEVAQDLAKSLVPTYPTLVVAPAAPGSRMFRVVIGPLNRAESGTLLTWFRYRGFPDAFVKQTGMP